MSPKVKWTSNQLADAVKESFSWNMLRSNLGGSSRIEYLKAECSRLDIDTSHFVGRLSTKRKWTDDQLIDAVKKSLSWRDVCKFLGIAGRGGSYPVIKNAVLRLSLDTSHFLGRRRNLGKEVNQDGKRELRDLLREDVVYSSDRLKKRLFRAGIKQKICERCGRVDWYGKEIPLELHHINGIHSDNRIENLMILCANCHATIDK